MDGRFEYHGRSSVGELEVGLLIFMIASGFLISSQTGVFHTHSREACLHFRQLGLISSHFIRRMRQVRHPVFVLGLRAGKRFVVIIIRHGFVSLHRTALRLREQQAFHFFSVEDTAIRNYPLYASRVRMTRTQLSNHSRRPRLSKTGD